MLCHRLWIIPILTLPLLAGCYNTARSKADARALAEDLRGYRDAQDARIKRLNQEYREAFGRLMDTLDDLTATELQQGRDADAQSIADSLIRDTYASLRGQFRGSFANALAQQRRRIADADVAVATVRADYQKAYSDAKLQTGKIDLAMKNLLAISQDPDDQQKIRQAIHFIQVVRDSVREAKKAATSQPTTGSSSGGSGNGQ